MYRLDVIDYVIAIVIILGCERAVPSIPKQLTCVENGSCKILPAPSIELNAANIMGYDMGLYNLQHLSITCARNGGPNCLKPIRTWPKNRISK